jgi:mono/diheme cytochrome c family protein
MSRWLLAIVICGVLLVSGCRSVGQQPRAVVPFAVAPNVGAAQPAGLGPTVTPTNTDLWRMSRDPAIVATGRSAFNASSCRTCHAVSLTGGPGPNLVDQRWLHGGTPQEVFQTITKGVQSKGMPQWGPVLGPAMITQIVAFIFSFHREGEPIEVQASFTPFTPVYE